MSTLNVSNITDGTTTVGTSYVVNGSAKAWASTSGSGTPVTDDSFNIASLTDVGTGQLTLNLTNSFSSAYYSSLGGGQRSDGATQSLIVGNVSKSAGSTQFNLKDDNGSSYDTANGSFTWHGELA